MSGPATVSGDTVPSVATPSDVRDKTRNLHQQPRVMRGVFVCVEPDA